MKLKINEDKLSDFKTVFKSLKNINDEITINCKDDGIEIFIIDKAKVLGGKYYIKKEVFEIYEHKNDKLTFEIKLFTKLLNRCTNAEIYDENNKLYIKGKTLAKLNLLETEDSLLKNLPVYDYTTIFTVNNMDFLTSLDDIDVFEGKEKEIKFSSDETIKLETGNDKKENITIDIEVEYSRNGKNISIYSFELFKKMKIPDFEKVKISYANEDPIRLDYKNDNIEINLFLAARVSND